MTVFGRPHLIVIVNQGLKYVNINCDVINTSENCDTSGMRSYSLATLPVTTEQSLNGSVTIFKGINSEVVIDSGCHNRLVFYIDTNIFKKVDVDALIELYIA